MKISKLKAYFLLQITFIAVLLLYQSMWFISPVIKGTINQHNVQSYTRTGGKAIVYDVEYFVDDEKYFVRENVVPLTDEVRYNFLFPGYATLNHTDYLWTPIITVYVILFLVSTIIFLPVKNNQIIANGSFIFLSSKKPFIKISPKL